MSHFHEITVTWKAKGSWERNLQENSFRVWTAVNTEAQISSRPSSSSLAQFRFSQSLVRAKDFVYQSADYKHVFMFALSHQHLQVQECLQSGRWLASTWQSLPPPTRLPASPRARLSPGTRSARCLQRTYSSHHPQNLSVSFRS